MLDALQSAELESVGGPQHPEPVTEPQTASKHPASQGPKAQEDRFVNGQVAGVIKVSVTFSQRETA